MNNQTPLLYMTNDFLKYHPDVSYSAYELIDSMEQLEFCLNHMEVLEWFAVVTKKNELDAILELAEKFTYSLKLVIALRTAVEPITLANVAIVPVEDWLRTDHTIASSPANSQDLEKQVTEPPARYEENESSIHFIDDVILTSGGDEISPQPLEVKYEENPLYSKTRNIQRKLFSQNTWSNHKIIGLWSATGDTGVTTLSVNFATYLAEQRIYTTVLEGITANPQLKTHLMRFNDVPVGWRSYASCIQEENDAALASWIYENVVFLPTQAKDLDYAWSPALIEAYMTTPKIADITLVDLPSGVFSAYTKDAAHFLDEIWLVFDDNYPELYKWKTLLQEYKAKYNVPIFGIQGRTYSFSKSKEVCKELNIPFLAAIPALDELAMQSFYTKKMLFQVDEAAALLHAPFETLKSHLSIPQSPKPLQQDVKTKVSKWFNFLKLQNN